MKITRDVVMDLLPLYVAGEASPDTCALVEEFLGQDAELRRQVEEARLEPLSAGGGPGSALPPELELRSLRRTRGLLRWQRLTYAWALTLSFLSLSCVFSLSEGHVRFHFLLFDYPGIVVPCIGLALSCWANYFFLRRRLRATKL